MNIFAIALAVVFLGFIVYFFIALGGKEIEPNDPSIARDEGQADASQMWKGTWYYADRGYRSWLERFSRRKKGPLK